MADEEQKIIVDSDWKAEAQAEKDRLAAEKRDQIRIDNMTGRQHHRRRLSQGH